MERFRHLYAWMMFCGTLAAVNNVFDGLSNSIRAWQTRPCGLGSIALGDAEGGRGWLGLVNDPSEFLSKPSGKMLATTMRFSGLWGFEINDLVGYLDANPYGCAMDFISLMSQSARGRKQDRARVAGGQDHEVRYEAKKEGVTVSKVKETVREVGNSRKRVGKAGEISPNLRVQLPGCDGGETAAFYDR